MCKGAGVKIISRSSHTLYELEEISRISDGSPPLTYTKFQRLITQLGPPKMPVSKINPETVASASPYSVSDGDSRYSVPNLVELGFSNSQPKGKSYWVGGETEALSRLERYLEHMTSTGFQESDKITATILFGKNRFELSPYLRYGCLSARFYYHRLMELYRKVKKETPNLSTYDTLLWRDFLYLMASHNANFDQMTSNPICIQVPWSKNPRALAKWANGQTGFPWIDAAMGQLREEGWVHQEARRAVISFLTRGHLWISWEDGEAVFF